MDSRPSGIEVRRANDRFRTERNGITTLHSFSYGGHYDADNIGFGPIIAINEEQVAPAGGYDTHHHADVEIVTWVLEGALAHEDTAGSRGVIAPGTLHWLSAGDGVQHAEHNASATEPLRFIQTMLRSDFDGEPTYADRALDDSPNHLDLSGRAPIDLTLLQGDGSVTLERPALVHVIAGEVRIGDHVLDAGDEARIEGGWPYDLSASDTAGAMIWQLQG